MQLVCRCLNVRVLACGDALSPVLPTENLSLSAAAEMDPFFADNQVCPVVLDGEDAVKERLRPCVRERMVGDWRVVRCLLCSMDVYAVKANGACCLVNAKLEEDPGVGGSRVRSADVSPVFGVVLPRNRVETGGEHGTSATSVNRRDVQGIQGIVNAFLDREQVAMDERIRNFVEGENAKFERLKAQAKNDRAIVVAAIKREMDEAEDGFDSAVPLSPVSAHSIELSPGLPMEPHRAKAHSNPASLTGWKRKRHSGGSGRLRELTDHAEEDVFQLEEQLQAQPFLDDPLHRSFLADDEAETDDSGTGEDFGKVAPLRQINGENWRRTPAPVNAEAPTVKFGTSLPVKIPGKWGPVLGPRQSTSEEEEVGIAEGDQQAPQLGDMAASIQQLARSMAAEDDPERLFGERPQRRRWKTGEMAQARLAKPLQIEP